MQSLGVAMNIHDLGVTEDTLDGIANGTLILEGGYKVLDNTEIIEILKDSMR